MSQKSVWVYCVGGGVSSLLLAAALARYPVLPGPVVVAEKKSKLGHPQSFGLWVGQTHPLDHLIKAKWPRWRFSLKGETSSVHSGLQQNYALIEGDDFFDWVSQSIESHPQISILLNTELTTPPVARHILDSRPPPLSHFKSCQTFVGYDVATTASGEYDCVDLMADMQMQDDSLVFLYRLPKPNGNTLIEWTAFGQRPFDLERLTALVEASIGNARIVRKEQGIIPMGVREISSWGTPIGTRGHMTRAASGYGFTTMWNWATWAAHQLVTFNALPKRSVHPAWVHWMDNCLVDIIVKAPHAMPEIFNTLAERLSGDQFAEFMMQPSSKNAWQVIKASPKRPFICSALGCTSWI